jgi:hypothetical protein
MLYRIFNNNHPLILFVLLVFTALIWFLPVNYNPEQLFHFNHYPTIFYLPIEHFNQLFPLWSKIIAFVIVFLLGLMVWQIDVKYQLTSSKNYFILFFFVTICATVKDFQFLNPILIALFFIILSFYRLFESYRRSSIAYSFFEASFLIALAGLFYSNSLYLIVFIITAFTILRQFNMREFIFVILGFMLPFFMVSFFSYYYTNNFFLFLDHIVSAYSMDVDRFQQIDDFMLAYLIVLGVMTIISVLFLFNNLYIEKVQNRNFFQVFFWFLMIAVLLFIFLHAVQLEVLLFLSLPLSFIFSNFLNKSKIKWLKELLLFLYLFVLLLLITR